MSDNQETQTGKKILSVVLSDEVAEKLERITDSIRPKTTKSGLMAMLIEDGITKMEAQQAATA